MAVASASRRRRAATNWNELHMAAAAIVAITAVYLVVSWQLGIPEASGLFGHSIGVLGFFMMLMTETLYSLRKRSHRRAWGRMADWLRFHIFTGIVGPYMVLLHSAWAFNGLAGLVLLLTALVVASGFFGRYIYTSIPRTADGVIIEIDQLAQMTKQAEQTLAQRVQAAGSMAVRPLGRRSGAAAALLLRGPARLAGKLTSWLRRQRLNPEDRRMAAEIDALHERLWTLESQVRNLAAARRLLALWHTLHVPLGLTLFLLAFFHIGAALYYATLLK